MLNLGVGACPGSLLSPLERKSRKQFGSRCRIETQRMVVVLSAEGLEGRDAGLTSREPSGDSFFTRLVTA
jgi:hypothetical protein